MGNRYRPLWPSAANTKDLNTVASRALSLLTEKERASVLRYYHVRDAKLALASALVKRYAISRFCGVPWSSAEVPATLEQNPCSAGLAVLFAVHNPPKGLAVGVDVVCPTERRTRDLGTLAGEGWNSFVDMHAEVFGLGEVTALKKINPGADVAERDRALRYFYALWCLREAYVKMTGEALLASWLRDLEMRGFAPPEDMTGPQEVWFNGEEVKDVDIKLVSLLGEYMISTAVRRGENGEGVEVGDFKMLDIEQVLAFGEDATDAL
ncbi:hypothetical protein CDV31_009511 [Fusarium ambrosium]|uniref:holo-[acyl-carrier-protein] synthase n=1 Tax=Fusarium ambrosium TaxID=131363 RepID=A0A428TU55_9HYPO|nr:hypothetical protein CDV31_009511 [Fusarium ambrosium]